MYDDDGNADPYMITFVYKTGFEDKKNGDDYDYIESHYDSDRKNYVFVDEVQLYEGFELAINSLHTSRKYDLYITGSNAWKK